MREELDPLLRMENHRVDDVVPAWLLVARYFGALAFVVVVGVAAWWVTSNEEKSDFIKPDQENNWWIIQLLGWSSALLFVRVYFYPSGAIDDFISASARCTHPANMFALFSFSFIPVRLIRSFSKKLQVAVRRAVSCVIFLCAIRKYDLCVIDMCEEHG
jgi:amino acid permease